MQLNKVLKGLLIAIPVIALTACSSTSQTDSGNSGSDSGSQQSQNASNNNAGGNSNVEVQTMTPEEKFLEEQKQKDAVLRQQHIIYFDFDRKEVRQEYVDLLEAHARYLSANPNVKIMIEGHCDERGTPEYNIALGERRAKSVAKFLSALGVSDNQIKMVSYGEEKRVDKSGTQAGMAKNRRAVLVY